MIYDDRFSLVSVNVRVNRQHSSFETPVATVGTVWESAADTWTSHVAIATADVGCLWCDWTHVAWQGLHTVDKGGVGRTNEKVRDDLAMKQTNKTKLIQRCSHLPCDVYLLVSKLCSLSRIANKFVHLDPAKWPCLISDSDLAPNRHQAVIWINTFIVYWKIPASLGKDESSGTFTHLLFRWKDSYTIYAE